MTTPDKKYYVYTLELADGKKYVGYTGNLEKRMDDHFNGKGSEVTKETPPVKIHSVNECKNIHTAKKAETIVYNRMKDYHGKDKVRGAGNTKRFSK
jgi:putative endonuclease